MTTKKSAGMILTTVAGIIIVTVAVVLAKNMNSVTTKAAITEEPIVEAAADDTEWQVNEENYYAKDYSGYRYPVLPGTEAWPYGNHWKMIEACQMTRQDCNALTTEELLQTVLDYPLAGDMFLFNGLDSGYDVLYSQFVGLQELSYRGDLRPVIRKMYQEVMGRPKNENIEVDSNGRDKLSVAQTEEEYIASRQTMREMVLVLIYQQLH